jgi:hypothetical protein
MNFFFELRIEKQLEIKIKREKSKKILERKEEIKTIG